MTCIAAVVSGSVVFMGADSVHASSHAIYARDEPKIFQNGDILIGAAGCVRVGQLQRCRRGQGRIVRAEPRKPQNAHRARTRRCGRARSRHRSAVGDAELAAVTLRILAPTSLPV